MSRTRRLFPRGREANSRELYHAGRDPANLVNLAADPGQAGVKGKLAADLDECLRRTGDPRALGKGQVWGSYPRYSPMRERPQAR